MKAAIIENTGRDKSKSLQEIRDLAEAASYEIEFEYVVEMDYPHSTKYLTEYKMEELKLLLEEQPVQKIIVNDQLAPKQTFHLEEELELDVIDKPMLILEIFENKANSKDIKMQVQLAQLKYSVPRMMTEIGEAVRSERPGFGGSGEQVTDIMVSDMYRRIRTLEGKLKQYKEKQEARLQSIYPRLPIVGYYSSGKSTLFNILCDEDRDIGAEAFTTMIMKTGRSQITGYAIDFIDTVGLVDLPTDILSAFEVMLSAIFSFSGLMLCIDASRGEEHAKLALSDFEEYVDRFTGDKKPRILIFLTKSDLVDPDEVRDLKAVVHHQEWLEEYEIITSSFHKPEALKQNFQDAFERLFADELLQFYYPHLSPSDASKLHDVARIMEQEWHNDGTTSLNGIGPKKILNQIRGEML
jgi:GTP-binding protein HflX